MCDRFAPVPGLARRAVATGGRRTGWPRRPALVMPRPGHPAEVLVTAAGRTIRAVMGRSAVATFKREGDGATPRCRMVPRAALVRGRPAVPPRPPLPLPWRPVRAADGWCDAPGHGLYNRYVKRPAPMSHEALARGDALYDVVVITDHNQSPRVQRGGSAIFLHVARPAMTPTEGCLAFPAAAWHRAMVPLGPYLIVVPQRPAAGARGRPPRVRHR